VGGGGYALFSAADPLPSAAQEIRDGLYILQVCVCMLLRACVRACVCLIVTVNRISSVLLDTVRTNIYIDR
jgi:hypothetical protein